MNLTDLAELGRLAEHRTSRQEIADLLRLGEAALADANVEAISLDRRFCAAYDAARTLATIALACAGYRPTGQGQHRTVFDALPAVLGEDYSDLAAYLNACRGKRNVAEYRRFGQIMDEEINELIETVESFRDEVLAWLQAHYPDMQPPR